MKRVETSTINNILTIDPFFLKEGLIYAKNKHYIEINIQPINNVIDENIDYPKDLKFELKVEDFKEYNTIEKLSITEHTEINRNDIKNFYSLNKLKSLSFQDKSFKLDFSKLPQLETLYFKYNKGITNLGALRNLKDLLIFSLNVLSCEILSDLTALEMLRLTRGNFTTLQGIENLKKVKRLDVTYNSKLTNAEAIAKLSGLEKLHIEKCKSLTNLSFLKDNTSIRELFIDNLDSLEFVATMPNLEKINFWSCKDGNMNPLLESKSLKQINFYPNKKYYTHTIEKIIELTGVQRGRNK